MFEIFLDSRHTRLEYINLFNTKLTAVDLSMKPHDDTKLPPPVRVIIKKYEFSKEDKDKSTAAAAVKHETDNAPIKDESQSADNKDAGNVNFMHKDICASIQCIV